MISQGLTPCGGHCPTPLSVTLLIRTSRGAVEHSHLEYPAMLEHTSEDKWEAISKRKNKLRLWIHRLQCMRRGLFIQELEHLAWIIKRHAADPRRKVWARYRPA